MLTNVLMILVNDSKTKINYRFYV